MIGPKFRSGLRKFAFMAFAAGPVFHICLILFEGGSRDLDRSTILYGLLSEAPSILINAVIAATLLVLLSIDERLEKRA